MENKKSKAVNTDEKMLSGVIEYSVLTKTPVFIPNTSNYLIFSQNPEKDKKENLQEIHKTYDFFSYNNLEGKTHGEKTYYEPVIPGSEIRGMFRSNFEILTNSCMSALDSDMQLSKRTMESYCPGLLQRKEDKDTGITVYDLYEATDVLWRTYGANNTTADLEWKNDNEHNNRKCYIQKDFAEGEKVKFILHKRKNKDGISIKPLASDVGKYNQKTHTVKNDNYAEGYIIKGEKSPGGPSRKHCCHIFVIKNSNSVVQSGVKISLFEDLLKVYADNELGNASHYSEYRKKFQEFKQGQGNGFFPVYYSIIKDVANSKKQNIFIAPACKTREIYDNTLKKLAKELAPCTGKSGYCEACELFGTVTDDDSKSSKIRFSDLVAEKKAKNSEYYVQKPITLPEMSSPKLNNMEFYLSKPKNAYFWTYDYYISADGRMHIEQGELSGRKFYWHQNIDDKYNPDEKRGKRNITIRPLRSNITFHGKLFFDRISKNTLDKLIYLVNAGDEEKKEISKKEHGYKIGMAKPLGLGSIACNVDKVFIKSYTIQDGKAIQQIEEIYNEYNPLSVRNMLDETIVKNYDKMTGFNSIQLDVKDGEIFSYPKINSESKGYEWFTKNHKGVKENRKETNNFPNARKDMVFLRYLKAMEERVQPTNTNLIKINNNNGQKKAGAKNSPSNIQGKHQKDNTSVVETATVLPYEKKNCIKFSIGGKKAQNILCERAGINPDNVQKLYPEGSQIKVRFKNKDSNGFANYEIVK